MKTEARKILIVISLCLSSGLLAMNSIPNSSVDTGATSPMLTPVTFANVSTVFAQVESVNWASL
jgi:hypothetical protein